MLRISIQYQSRGNIIFLQPVPGALLQVYPQRFCPVPIMNCHIYLHGRICSRHDKPHILRDSRVGMQQRED